MKKGNSIIYKKSQKNRIYILIFTCCHLLLKKWDTIILGKFKKKFFLESGRKTFGLTNTFLKERLEVFLSGWQISELKKSELTRCDCRFCK